jgi:hypothetical protein
MAKGVFCTVMVSDSAFGIGLQIIELHDINFSCILRKTSYKTEYTMKDSAACLTRTPTTRMNPPAANVPNVLTTPKIYLSAFGIFIQVCNCVFKGIPFRHLLPKKFIKLKIHVVLIENKSTERPHGVLSFLKKIHFITVVYSLVEFFIYI